MEALLPVIIGGIIGVAGGVIGPAFLYWRQSKDEERRRLAEKFEALVSAVYEHDHWLEAMRDHRLFRSEAPPAIPPLRKVQTLSAVYFSALVPSVSRLETGSRNYHYWILGRARAALDDPNADVQEGYREAYLGYATQRDALLEELHLYARTHLSPVVSD